MNNKFTKKALAMSIAATTLALSQATSAYEWDGLYAGVNAGIGTFNGKVNNAYGDHGEVEGAASIGATVGYNWSNGSAVYGIEADINAGDTAVDGNPYDYNTYYYESEWNWFSTIRGRAGLAVDNALIYVTGGLLIADTEYLFCDDSALDCFGDNEFRSSGIEYGLTFGMGLDIAINDSMILKAEYIHAESLTVSELDFSGYNMGFDSSLNTLRVGVNWKL